MNRSVGLLIGCIVLMSPPAPAQDAAALAALRAACASDAQKFCAGVPAGGGRIIACLKEHRDSLSDQCKQAAQGAQAAYGGGSSAATAGTAAASPSTAAGATAASGATQAASTSSATPAAASATTSVSSKSSHPAHTAAGGSGTATGYLRLKRVQIVAHVNDPSLGPGPVDMPAEDLLVPSSWDFKGSVAGNTMEGCYSDFYALAWQATSPDGGIVFVGAPNYSWQYADDPSVLRKLTDPNRRQLGLGGKPCPVEKPMKAEAYLRQKMLEGATTVISVEPFPELDRIARLQLGLAASAAGDSSGTQTEAIRAHVESQSDGKPLEGWVTVVVVTRIFRQGRGAFYDCHAIDAMALKTPKGKLDANDKLFKVMMGSIRTEPKWDAYSGNFIAKLYQIEARKEATIDATIAAFQNQVAQTIMGVTARAAQGANQAAFGEDQIIRGVQTFRDPSTGKTMELSNLYDHAWLNGSNEYVMSDDPNFNPNGKLTGDWSQLQPVRAAP
ncbi:MAG TPA: cysteine rich repeat-containing protein [Steroidobacteraceae bacterium]|jgi:hypothetical protein|nr:cysteine rich repeat-containing protein [Steroidobacteraceae bacterium]